MMKRMILIAISSISLIATAELANARKVGISRKVSPAELESICAAQGGTFWSNNNGYSCVKANCDGKGHSCAVVCDMSANCEGIVPVKVPPGRKDLQGIFNPPVTKAQ
jgi:hypothetical protein